VLWKALRTRTMTRGRHQLLVPVAPTRGVLCFHSKFVCFKDGLPGSSARDVADDSDVEGLRRGHPRTSEVVSPYCSLLIRGADRIRRGPLRARDRAIPVAAIATARLRTEERERLGQRPCVPHAQRCFTLLRFFPFGKLRLSIVPLRSRPFAVFAQ
jgi:hypothetical protein